MKYFLGSVFAALCIVEAVWAAPRCVAPLRQFGAPDYALRRGESICFGKQKVVVTFTKLLSDARCPAHAKCFPDGGPVRIRASFKAGRRAPISRILSVWFFPHAPNTDHYRFAGKVYTFTGLTPSPRDESGKPVRAHFSVSSAAHNKPAPAYDGTCTDPNMVCIQVLACGKMPDGSWRLFPTPCDAACAGAAEITYSASTWQCRE